MATLRSPYDSVDNNLTGAEVEGLRAANMGQLRRGWESGRIGGEINPLAIQEAGLRSAAEQGDPRAAAQADALRQQITGLQQRQQAYAPAVGRVEDINWEPGKALDWGLSQVGQGAASMADPIAASAALGAAGNVMGLSKNPLAQAASLAARGLSIGVPAYMSQRQQAGETYNAMTEDPALMARTTAAERYHNANISGAIQAIPDTFLPAMVGGRLAGAGLRKGVSAMPTGLRVAGDLLGEGAGEVFQEWGKQKTLGYMNPDRDTSRDNSDLFNAGLGAMAGAGPVSGGSHLVDAGFRRVGAGAQAGADLVKEAAGGVVDLYNDKAKDSVDAGVKKARGWIGRGKEAMVDLATGDDGKVTPESVLAGLKQAATDLSPAEKAKMSADERAHLEGMPPDEVLSSDDAAKQWFAENDTIRPALVQKKLQEIDNPQAKELLGRIDDGSANLSEGAAFILQHDETNSWEDHAAGAGQMVGAVGKTIGGLAARAAKGVYGAGKEVVSGFADGMKSGERKLNAQSNEGSDFTFSDWRKMQDSLSAQPLAEGASYNRSVAFARKAKLAGDYAADMASRKWGEQSSVPKLARRLAFELADMETGFKTPNAESPGRAAPVARETRLNRLTGDIRRTYGSQSEEVIDNLGKIMGPGHNDITSYMKRELVEQSKPDGVRREQQRRNELAQSMLSAIPDDKAQALMDQGVNLRAPGAADHLLSSVEKLVSGYHGSSTPAYRTALEQHFGREAVGKMIGVLNDADSEKQSLGGEVVDDRGNAGEQNGQEGMLGVAQDENGDWSYDAGDKAAAEKTSAFVQRRAEKDAQRGRVEDLFGSHKSPTLSVSDPFTKDKNGKRQRLFAQDTALFNKETGAFDKPALASRLKEMPEKIGLQSKDYVIAPKNALAVMADLGWDDAGKTPAVGDQRTGGALVEAHRDYLTQEAEDAEQRATGGKVSPAEAQQLMRQAADIRTELAKHAPAHDDLLNAASNSSPVARRQAVAAARKYFSGRYLAAASMPGDREITRITYSDLKPMVDSAKRAMDFARKAGGDEKSMAGKRGDRTQMSVMGNAAHAKALSDANLLHFTSTTPGGPPVTIRAGDLVRFVRSRNAEKPIKKQGKKPEVEDFSPDGQDKAYLRDLMSGIAIMMGSKLVRANNPGAPSRAAMPYKTNADGAVERFTRTSVPPSLRLVNKTVGELEAARQEEVSKKRDETAMREQEIFTMAYGSDVAARAMAKRDTSPGGYYMQQLTKASAIAERKGLADPSRREAGEAEMAEPERFVPDSEADEVEPTPEPSPQNQGRLQKLIAPSMTARDGQFSTNPTSVTGPRMRTDKTSLRQDGQRVTEYAGETSRTINASKPKTSYDGTSPLDFFGEQEEGAVPDDFADQQYFTRNSGATAYGVGREAKMTAMSGATRRADETIALAGKDLNAATEAIMSRMRSALRPESSDQGNDVVGGPYYAAPLAVMLAPDKLVAPAAKDALPGEMDSLPGGATLLMEAGISPSMVRDMRRVVTEVLLDTNNGMRLQDRVALARKMAKDPSKITGLTYQNLLSAALEGMGGPVDKSALFNATPGKKQPAAGTSVKNPASAEAQKPTAQPSLMGRAISQRQEYLANPPASYTTEKATEISTWAKGQLERVNTARKAPGVSDERMDELSGHKSALEGLIEKAGSMVEGDKSLGGFEGTSPAAPEVGARLGKSRQSGGPDLGNTGPYGVKDQAKSDQATKFIGRGSPESSTAKYAKAWGGKANTGSYTAEDKVFVSAEGQRSGRVDPDFAEIGKATKAGATIITDDASNRKRLYNLGERQVAEFLEKQGYAEKSPGVWTSGSSNLWNDSGRKLSKMSQKIHDDLGRDGFAATHDSPHKHEGKFDWRAHIGKGEGNAAFGAGTYLSTSEGVHKSYKGQFTAFVRVGILQKLDRNVLRTAIAHMEELSGTEWRSYKDLNGYPQLSLGRVFRIKKQLGGPLSGAGAYSLEYDDGGGAHTLLYGASPEWLLAHMPTAAQLKAASVTDAKSPTYEVSVGIKPDQLLDWDKPLNEQSALVQKASAGADGTSDPWEDNWNYHSAAVSDGSHMTIEEDHGGIDGEFKYFVTHSRKNIGEFDTLAEAKKAAVDHLASLGLSLGGAQTGADLYGALTKQLGSQAAASDYLQSLGILGHKYAASGGRNETHPNYVIYDDSKITTNYVHFNKQDARKGAAGEEAPWEDRAKAISYVRSVLGNDIKLDFEKITGYSGEWIEAENVIKISTTAAAGTMQTAYHEALHAFFSKFVKNNPQVFEVLKTLAEDHVLFDRVNALLDGYPAAQQQYRENGEERLAYIYQFWAAGELDLPTKPTTIFSKLTRFFRRVLGRITDSERATALLEAFHRGDFAKGPSVAGKVINKTLLEGTLTRRALKKVDFAVQKVAAFVIPAHQMLLGSDSPMARQIAKDFWSNPGDAANSEGEGYLNARLSEATRYKNLFGEAITGLSDRDLKDVTKHLQAGTLPADIPYAPHRAAVKSIRHLLQRFFRYMKDERGMDIGNVDGELYFPRVWSQNQLMDKQVEFLAMLTSKYGDVLQQGVAMSGGKVTQEEVAQRIWNAIANRSYDDSLVPARDDGVLSPFFASKEIRSMKWLDNADAEPFLNKDLIGTLTTYFHNGARAAEYTSRFGEKGEILDQHLQQVENELIEAGEKRMRKGELKDKAARDKWVGRQMHNVRQAVGAMEGTIGKGELSSTWRNTSAWLTTYQNVRLLPMALFSSLVDPLGMVARGATMTEAYDTFLRSMKEVLSTWGDLFRDQPKARKVDEWEKLAMAVGSVDAAMFSHHVADEYSSAYMGKGAKKVNEMFFKANGMEALNRGMRVGATKSAVLFLQRHRTLPEVHSKRWLKELELTPQDLTVDADGNLILDKHDLTAVKGVSMPQAEREIAKLYYAINQWVTSAVLTPNAAQRPSWSSDPTWSVLFHLKQFSYSFHQTILKRAMKEMHYGNLAPIGAFAGYIPVMIGADIIKGLIQGGGELPGHMKGMDLGDWVAHGANRAGLLGVGQLGIDAGHDIWSLGGPAAEQIADAFVEPLTKTTIKALPAHALYAEGLK